MPALFSKEKFEEMRLEMDKDGDGQVEKDEFKAVFLKAFPDTTDEEYDIEWGKIDADGDGNLTVRELATYYGFDLDGEDSNEMTDEQILQALSMQAALDEMNEKAGKDKKEKKEERKEPVGRDKTIKQVNLDNKKKSYEDAKEEKGIEFLEELQIKNLWKPTQSDEKRSVDFIIDPQNTGQADEAACNGFYFRIMDMSGEMPLHKLARCKVAQKDGDRDTDGRPLISEVKFNKIFNAIIQNTKKEGKLCNPPKTLYADINHQDNGGKTPLYLAIEHSNHLMIENLFKLKKDGPDSLMVSSTGWSCMHAAVHTDDLATIKSVVMQLSNARVKALLQTMDKSGREPLHIAAYKCQENVINYLLSLGAKDTKKDTGGSIPSALAERSGRRDSKELIEAHTGRNSKEDMGMKGKSRRASRDSRASRESEGAEQEDPA